LGKKQQEAYEEIERQAAEQVREISKLSEAFAEKEENLTAEPVEAEPASPSPEQPPQELTPEARSLLEGNPDYAGKRLEDFRLPESLRPPLVYKEERYGCSEFEYERDDGKVRYEEFWCKGKLISVRYMDDEKGFEVYMDDRSYKNLTSLTDLDGKIDYFAKWTRDEDIILLDIDGDGVIDGSID
jgi:hypothetical protein